MVEWSSQPFQNNQVSNLWASLDEGICWNYKCKYTFLQMSQALTALTLFVLKAYKATVSCYDHDHTL